MSRGLTFQPEGFYHIYNRGTERRDVFISGSDYDRFISLLYLANNQQLLHRSNYQGRTLPELLALTRGETLVDVCAYCLMPNHFHLLVREHTENGISKFMQKLMTGYTMYFNKLHERTGALFQSKFKARDANDDSYLRYLISYIHLNPVKLVEPLWKEKGISDTDAVKEYLASYIRSSYLDFMGVARAEGKILNMAVLPDYFAVPHDFETSVNEWLDYQNS